MEPEQNLRPQSLETAVQRSSTGLDENVAGLLAYLGLFVSGALLLVFERESSFVRFHALQSTVTFLGLFVIQLVLGWIPFLGALVGLVVSVATVGLWILLMMKAYQGERYQLPFVGEIAEERSRR